MLGMEKPIKRFLKSWGFEAGRLRSVQMGTIPALHAAISNRFVTPEEFSQYEQLQTNWIQGIVSLPLWRSSFQPINYITTIQKSKQTD